VSLIALYTAWGIEEGGRERDRKRERDTQGFQSTLGSFPIASLVLYEEEQDEQEKEQDEQEQEERKSSGKLSRALWEAVEGIPIICLLARSLCALLSSLPLSVSLFVCLSLPLPLFHYICCVCARAFVRTYTHARTNAHTHTHARTHAHTQTHTHRHTHTHTHTHTHIHTAGGFRVLSCASPCQQRPARRMQESKGATRERMRGRGRGGGR
jgi:hypothetical protein